MCVLDVLLYAMTGRIALMQYDLSLADIRYLHSSQRVMTRHPTRGSGSGGLQNPTGRVESSRVGSGQVGSGQVRLGRVWSGLVGSGRVRNFSKSHGSGHVTLTRPGLTREI